MPASWCTRPSFNTYSGGILLNYPDNFETPTFPAGRPVALSRTMSIGIMASLLLIAFLCVFIFWAARSRTVHPFLVSINDMTGQWSVIGHDHGEKTITANQTLQESVLAHFIRNWFTISPNLEYNTKRWAPLPDGYDCADGNPNGLIACSISDDLYKQFTETVLPGYETRILDGETWSISLNDLRMTPINGITPIGGIWQVYATIESNVTGPIDIIAYATIAQDKQHFPQTMGYYITDFDAYRLN